MSFVLHPQLAADCISIGDLSVCRVLLMNNRNFPWLILVPRRKNLREIFDLSAEDYQGVMAEVRQTAQQFAAFTEAHKMNVAALGNIVPQLHIHIIARKPDDKAWPNPVWNAGIKPELYATDKIPTLVKSASQALGLTNITKM